MTKEDLSSEYLKEIRFRTESPTNSPLGQFDSVIFFNFINYSYCPLNKQLKLTLNTYVSILKNTLIYQVMTFKRTIMGTCGTVDS